MASESCEVRDEEKEYLKISLGLWDKNLKDSDVLDPLSAFGDLIQDLLKKRRYDFNFRGSNIIDSIARSPLWVSYMLGYGSASMHYIPMISNCDIPDLARLISPILYNYGRHIRNIRKYEDYRVYVENSYTWNDDNMVAMIEPKKVKATHFIAIWLQIFFDQKEFALMHIFEYLDKYLAEQFEKDNKAAADKALDDHIERNNSK